MDDDGTVRVHNHAEDPWDHSNLTTTTPDEVEIIKEIYSDELIDHMVESVLKRRLDDYARTPDFDDVMTSTRLAVINGLALTIAAGHASETALSRPANAPAKPSTAPSTWHASRPPASTSTTTPSTARARSSSTSECRRPPTLRWPTTSSPSWRRPSRDGQRGHITRENRQHDPPTLPSTVTANPCVQRRHRRPGAVKNLDPEDRKLQGHPGRRRRRQRTTPRQRFLPPT